MSAIRLSRTESICVGDECRLGIELMCPYPSVDAAFRVLCSAIDNFERKFSFNNDALVHSYTREFNRKFPKAIFLAGNSVLDEKAFKKRKLLLEVLKAICE